MSFHSKITLEKEIFIDKNFIFEKKRVTVRWKQTDAQRAKIAEKVHKPIAEKVHKPPIRVSVINFELNGFNASIWVSWSPSDPKSYNALIEVFKFI